MSRGLPGYCTEFTNCNNSRDTPLTYAPTPINVYLPSIAQRALPTQRFLIIGLRPARHSNMRSGPGDAHSLIDDFATPNVGLTRCQHARR